MASSGTTSSKEGVFKPLFAYLESVGRLHALDVDLVLPATPSPWAATAASSTR